MQKKIGIITINDLNNYGNRLQCYAVQHKLESLGCIPENIYNSSKKKKKFHIKKYVKYILNIKFTRQSVAREKKFKEFNKKIKFSKYNVVNNKWSNKLNKEYDMFIVGSDQVWNPTFDTTTSADFLEFADKNKRVSFSASIGIDEIPQKCKKWFKDELKKFKCISVREDSGKKIVEQLTSRKDIEVNIDPTMLLTSNEWSTLMKRPKKYKGEKYILNYFLGTLDDEKYKIIKEIAEKKNAKIINILDKNTPYYMTGPSEFLWLEKNAELICTDSFHSCVFAILFDKPFIVFNRIQKDKLNMNSRIDTLISKFKLKGRRFNGKEITKENLNHDYTEAYKILEKEREKSEEFLKKALDIE